MAYMNVLLVNTPEVDSNNRWETTIESQYVGSIPLLSKMFEDLCVDGKASSAVSYQKTIPVPLSSETLSEEHITYIKKWLDINRNVSLKRLRESDARKKKNHILKEMVGELDGDIVAAYAKKYGCNQSTVETLPDVTSLGRFMISASFLMMEEIKEEARRVIVTLLRRRKPYELLAIVLGKNGIERERATCERLAHTLAKKIVKKEELYDMYFYCDVRKRAGDLGYRDPPVEASGESLPKRSCIQSSS